MEAPPNLGQEYTSAFHAMFPELAREHGIVTPYTAYLIIEDESRRGVPELSRTFRELEGDRWAADQFLTPMPNTNCS